MNKNQDCDVVIRLVHPSSIKIQNKYRINENKSLSSIKAVQENILLLMCSRAETNKITWMSIQRLSKLSQLGLALTMANVYVEPLSPVLLAS